tara:strand:- start:480 stop:1796 length:1317 start_codon:yes stop_codon:yes gene_type:complete
MILSREQQLAFSAFIEGKNVLITGPGGSGKSHLIKTIVKHSKEYDRNIQVCALTGCACVLLECGAKTLHSWGGIGLANGTIKDVVKRVTKNKHKRKAWLETDILVIDEVSMMSKKLFNILDLIGRIVRNRRETPFGGIQLILSGDFYQLPPIGNEDDEDSCAFCFESDGWQNSIDISIELKTIFRQEDENYKKILNYIRVGKITKTCITMLKSRVGLQPNDIIKPTIMYPRRYQADLVNSREYGALKSTEEYTYSIKVDIDKSHSVDDGDPDIIANSLRSSIMADDTITLKEGTQVMCIANIDQETLGAQIVNGSQGIVIGFKDELPIVKFRNGVEKVIGRHAWKPEGLETISLTQLPLIYAWAITIHKAQGVTLEIAEIDIGSHIFECGQTYVALSRVKSLEGLYLSSFDYTKIKVNSKVKQFYRMTSHIASQKQLT